MRRPLTEQDKAAIWAGSKAGVPLGTVARRLGRSPGTVHHYMALTGGMRPRSRRAREGQLTLVEREELSRGLAAGRSLRAIARELRRSPSTVSREVARNGGREGYRAAKAHQDADRRARRPKPARLATNLRLQQVVADKLRLRWSPQQIAHWLPEQFPNDPEMRVSHETIYLSLFVQARGALKREIAHHLRTGR